MPEAGTLLVGQSGGGTPVINATLVGVVEAAQAGPSPSRIVGLVHGIEGLLRGETVDLGGLPAGDLDRLAATPSAALGSCRYKLREDDLDRVIDRLQALGAGSFCYIGGDDSARTTAAVARAAASADYPLTTVAAPKTIDNDLPEMDHTPGYGSAARFLIAATRDIVADAWAMRRVEPVRLIETKGRDSGWLTVAAAAARDPRPDPEAPPHLLYIPERRISIDRVLADVEAVLGRHGYCVAVVAETVRDETGALLGDDQSGGFVDAFGHRYSDGPAPFLAREVARRLHVRARFDRPGTLLKTAAYLASPVDRVEAREVGRAAVRLAQAAAPGDPPQMITLERSPGAGYNSTTGSVGLDRVLGRVKTFPEAWLAPNGRGVAPAFFTYLDPLLGDPLPAHFRLVLD
ncbi:MAG TPA: diphosphate--fructose-6-phosphate 1-phosphotransferase [Dehalococcoidia bacterium]|nr:diphosphate--fructose-6-phosphate 1-phosphotransferase [Dehalococcoidia bacterium]